MGKQLNKLEHKWMLRDDGKYECDNCRTIISEQTLQAIKSVRKTLSPNAKLNFCKGSEMHIINDKIYDPVSEKKVSSFKEVESEISKLFQNAKVLTFEELLPIIDRFEDSEDFWCEIDGQEGMLAFLDKNGFEMIPCKKKGEKYLSEIYVNFDRFTGDIPHPQPTLSVSDPAKELFFIHQIKKFALNLAQETNKGLVEISKYGRDGFKLFFSDQLVINHNQLKKQTLDHLSKEMGFEVHVE